VAAAAAAAALQDQRST